MRKLLFLLCFLFTQPLLALDYSTETALSNLKSCLGKVDLSCSLTGTCNACDWCGKVDKIPADKCDKGSSLAALEGFLGVTEGYCTKLCGAKNRIGSPVFLNAKQGDVATVISSSGSNGVAHVITGAGEQSLQTFYTQSKLPSVGSSFSITKSSVSGPIAAAFSCVSGTSNKWLKECFKGWVNCDGNIKKAQRCEICKDVKKCATDTEEAMSAFFGLNRGFCGGC